jgi:hypothetical protein
MAEKSDRGSFRLADARHKDDNVWGRGWRVSGVHGNYAGRRASWHRRGTADAIRSFDSLNLGGHPDVRIRSGDMTLRPTSDIARAGRAGVAVLQARSGRACSEGVRVRRYRGAG